MNLYWLWATLGLFLLGLEIFTSTQFFLFFLGAACLMTSALGNLLSLSVSALFWTFAIISIGLLILWKKYFTYVDTATVDVNSPLLSMKGSLAEVITCDNIGNMKVRIGHTLWSAIHVEHKKIAAHAKVKVIGLDRLKLLVASVEG